MQTISDEYRGLNQQLHADKKEYGTSGSKWALQIMEMCKTLETRDVLDYGCGKSTLANNLPFSIRQYDPAIPKYSERPSPADLVVCTDVLEHIEPEFLDAVFDDLQRLTRKMGYFVIATGPANKTLADGRNAHLIQEGPRWWLPKIMQRFELKQFVAQKKCFMVLVKPC